jgi:hypothetical protein
MPRRARDRTPEVRKENAKPVSKSVATVPATNPNALHVRPLGNETESEALARYSMEPAVQGALTMSHWSSSPLTGLSLDVLVKNLSDQCALSNIGDLSRSEAILTAQIATLNQIFHNLAATASLNLIKNLKGADTVLRLAFKAQSQCRCSIEALAEIKNPRPVAFVRQANISAGPQQVNNGTGARAEKHESPPNELLECVNGYRLDIPAQSSSIRAHSKLEAVGTVNGTEIGGRQVAGGTQRLQG